MPPEQALRSTDLVHEAYVRLVRRGTPSCETRSQFFAEAVRAMQDILIVLDAGPRALVFRTFLYCPGIPPWSLGLAEDDGYPGQHAPLRVALFLLSTRPVEVVTSERPSS